MGEVVLIGTGTRGHRDENRGRSSAGDRGRIIKNRETCGTAVSKLHGRAPNPRAVSARGGAQSVEVGDFPLLESIFMIFGKSSAVSAEYEILRAISSRNDQK